MKLSWKHKAIFWNKVPWLQYPPEYATIWDMYYNYFTIAWLDKGEEEWGYDCIEYQCQKNKMFSIGRLSFQWGHY